MKGKSWLLFVLSGVFVRWRCWNLLPGSRSLAESNVSTPLAPCTRRITRQCSAKMVTDFDLELRKPSSFVSIRASDGLADGVVELTYRVRGLGHTSHRSYIGTDRLQSRSPHCLPRRILEARSYSYKTRHHYTMSNNSPSSSTPEDVPRVLARNTACLPCR